MKRTYVMVAIVAAVGLVTYWALAAETSESNKGMMGQGMMEKGMMGQGTMSQGTMGQHMTGQSMMGGGMMGGMCPMHMMMGRMASTVYMVPTSDDGAIVIMGKTLFKYDKDLKLVKQTEMRIDLEAMCREMKEMVDKCPACKQVMGTGAKEGSM